MFPLNQSATTTCKIIMLRAIPEFNVGKSLNIGEFSITSTLLIQFQLPFSTEIGPASIVFSCSRRFLSNKAGLQDVDS